MVNKTLSLTISKLDKNKTAVNLNLNAFPLSGGIMWDIF
jgi:hypothetical protein